MKEEFYIVEYLKEVFAQARFDNKTHHGLGDIILTFSQQEDIIEGLKELEKTYLIEKQEMNENKVAVGTTGKFLTGINIGKNAGK